jgi:DNA-binding transcriptional ArsR family regulator
VARKGSSAGKSLFAQAEEAAKLLKLLGNPQRLMILCLLCDGAYPVGVIEERLKIRQPTLSQQLAALREAGAIEGRREAKAVIYCLADERVLSLIGALHAVFCPRGEQNWLKMTGTALPGHASQLGYGAAHFARVLKRETG